MPQFWMSLSETRLKDQIFTSTRPERWFRSWFTDQLIWFRNQYTLPVHVMATIDDKQDTILCTVPPPLSYLKYFSERGIKKGLVNGDERRLFVIYAGHKLSSACSQSADQRFNKILFSSTYFCLVKRFPLLIRLWILYNNIFLNYFIKYIEIFYTYPKKSILSYSRLIISFFVKNVVSRVAVADVISKNNIKNFSFYM